MTRATWMVAKMEKTSMENQKPSLPEFFTASSPLPRPAAIDLEAGQHVVALVAEAARRCERR